MPSKSEKQARFMRAVAHGWKPTRTKAPPVSVAKEFVEADKAKGMYEGGLAPMNDILQRGFAPGLTGTVQSFQDGGTVEGISLQEAVRRMPGSTIKNIFQLMRGHEGWFLDRESGLVYPPQPTILGDAGPTASRADAGGYDPYYGRGPGYVPSAGDFDFEEIEGRMGPRGRRGGGPRGGRRRPPPPRDIPGAGPPGVVPPGRDPGGDLIPPVDYTPPDPRAGRETPYSQALRAHQARIAASLGVPPGGFAEGGKVKGYQEGGTARADNPYPVGSARWKIWERKHGRDPNEPEPKEAPPPVAEAEPEEDVSWWDRLRGYGSEEDVDRIEEKLRELEQARGGYVGYQLGGTVDAANALRSRMGTAANRFAAPPRGGVPPSIQGMMGPRRGGIPPRISPRVTELQGQAGALQQALGPGRPAPRMVPPTMRRLPPRGMPWRGAPPPRIRPTPGVDPRGGPGVPPQLDGVGPMGGPRIAPNLRGYMQRAMMMNRPRRGIPGPAGAGGAPNRVGQRDQQGALARALQRGTGRPPMSRRQGFYR